MDRIIYKSFNPSMLSRLKKLAPNIPSLYVFLLSYPSIPFTINSSITWKSPFEENVNYSQEHYYFITKNFVKEAHARGFKIVAWGVDSEEQMRKALKFGVDAIETDNLDTLIRINYYSDINPQQLVIM